jgi:hemerythrin-like domain-containing protein
MGPVCCSAGFLHGQATLEIPNPGQGSPGIHEKKCNDHGAVIMDTICAYLKHDHQRCDDLFYEAESSVAQRNWKAAIDNFRRYQDILRQHIRMEEKILLPTFELTLAGSAEPVAMLRMEHKQINGIVNRMWEAVHRFDAADYVLHAETLTLLMQQHTLKEEEMLYPLLDKALAGKRSKIIHAMAEYLEAATPNLAAG